MTRGCLAAMLVAMCVTLRTPRVAYCVLAAVVALHAWSSVLSFSVEWSVLRKGGKDCSNPVSVLLHELHRGLTVPVTLADLALTLALLNYIS